MVKLTDIRREVFANQPTLMLFYSEPDGDPILLQALLECTQNDTLFKGVRGCERPKIERRPIVCGHHGLTLGSDSTPAEALRSADLEIDLQLQHQLCSVHMDRYPQIAKDLLSKLGQRPAQKRMTPRGLEVYYALRAGELLAVAIFDLSLMPKNLAA